MSSALRVELYFPCVYAEFFGWQQLAPPAYRGYHSDTGYSNMLTVPWGIAYRRSSIGFNTTGMPLYFFFTHVRYAVVSPDGLTVQRPRWSTVASGTSLSYGIVWIGPPIRELLAPYEKYAHAPLALHLTRAASSSLSICWCCKGTSRA